jgi:prenyl protein peptidase
MSSCLNFGNEWLAVGYAVLCALMFVSSLYVRGDVRVSRNDRSEVKRRMVAVSVAAVIGIVLLRVAYDSEQCKYTFLSLCGVRFDQSALVAIAALMLHVVLLFAGPLVQEWYEGYDEDWRNWSLLDVRNLVFAPVLEEVVFRALVCAALRIGAGWSAERTVIVSSLLFGAAHMHHIVHHVVVERIAWSRAAVAVLGQFLYTTLFGLYTAYVYVQYGHLLAVCLLHSFCNRMGFPDVLGAREHVGVAVAYVVGLALFVALFGVLTDGGTLAANNNEASPLNAL